MMPDPYAVLGVSADASADEIRAAYKKLAQQLHPDKHPDDVAGATKRFQELDEAYTILADSTKRARYDDLGDTEETAENQLRAHAIDLLTGSALELMGKPGDHHAALRIMCAEGIAKRAAAIRDAHLEIEKHEAFAKRWKNKLGGRNIFANALRREVLKLRDHIETSKVSIELMQECLCILAAYEYRERAERPPALSFSSLYRADVP